MMNGIQQTVTHSLDMNEQTLRDYFTKRLISYIAIYLLGNQKASVAYLSQYARG